MKDTRLYGIGTGLAPFTATQQHSHHFMRHVIEATATQDEEYKALLFLDEIHASCGIDRRYSVLEDYTRSTPENFDFFPPNWRLDPLPSTERRMEVYEPASVNLAELACRRALDDARVGPEEITDLVVVTCTGLFAPGPDILLTRRLGLSPQTRRTVIGFMGCYGAFNGLRTARQIVASERDALVLVVCVELCTLHFQTDLEPQVIIGNCLFGDGSAAAVLGSDERLDGGYADLATSHCHVTGDSLHQMQWHIGDHGFSMVLDVEIPDTLHRGGAKFIDTLLDGAKLGRRDVDTWLVHPGGPKIIDAVRDAAGLQEEQVALSRTVLRDFGNMSSATILFVLERQLKTAGITGPTTLLGFGPGLTLEGAVLSPPQL